MKNVFEFIRKRLRLFVLAWVVLMVITFCVRLAQGPIRVDGIRPIIESRFAAQLPHTHTAIKHLDLVWFADARAVGFRFEDLIITDRNNRIIARAGKMETALAADSLLLLHMAPARLTAEDFFVAASVSREGRYDLGFDAHGTPGSASGLDRFFYDLTGPERLGEPVSFTRQVLLKNGELRFTQEGAPLDWTAHVQTIDFTKLRGKLTANADLVVKSEGLAGRVASLKASATGTVGLKKALISANLRGLYPSHVFPSVGATKVLAGVNAPLDGLARVDYSKKKGFEGAWLDLAAGQGRIDAGDLHQTFDGARVRARYTSSDHTAIFQTFQLRSHLFDGDLSGKVQMLPHDDRLKRYLTLNFDFSGARVTGRLADDFAPQTLTNARFKGNYIPRQRRLHYDRVSGLLNGAPLESQGTLFTNDQGQLGADLTARIKGRFTKEEVFAFWPQDLSAGTRKMLIERIVGGDFANANFVLKAPPGHFEHDALVNSDLRLDFDFDNLELEIESRLHHALGLRGHGILMGDSFAMDVGAGRLDNVQLSKGRLSVPAFHDHRSHAHIELDSTAEVPDIIEAIDPVTNNQLQPHGLNRERLSGTAVSHVVIDFPTFEEITERNFGLTFQAKVSHAAFKQAALGWDMTDGTLQVNGDLLANNLVVAGPAQLGPYAGDVTYQTQMNPKTQVVDFKGHFNAAQFGGSPKVPVAIKGHFTIANRAGQGRVDSDIFHGNVTWSGDTTGAEERPTRMTVEGAIRSDGMEDQGLPIFEHLPRDLPTRITLARSGDIWSGELDAEAIGGDIAYVQGARPRLVYKSTITPEDAEKLGYGALPVFSVPRRLTVNISLDGVSKTALLRLDNINATLGWQEIPGTDEVKRRVDMRLTPDDWYALGLPRNFFKPQPLTDVSAIWQQTDTLLTGQVLLLDQTIDFDMPLHRRGDPSPISLPNTSIPYEIQVRGQATPRLLGALGYTHDPLRVGGNSDVVFSLYNTPGQPAAVLNVDATQAQLGVKATDWNKPVGETATLAFSFDDQGGSAKGLNVSRIYGEGPRISIDGRAAFSPKGDLQFADFSKVYLKDFIDIAYRFYAIPDQGGRNVLSITGQQLDLRPWLDNSQPQAIEPVTPNQAVAALAQGTPPAMGQPTRFVVNVDRLRMVPGPAFRQLSLDLNWDGRNGWDGTGSAATADGSPVTLISKSKGAYSLFSLQSMNLGNAIETATGNTTIKGGQGAIEGVYADGNADALISGRNVRVQQIPALAQLLTVASLQGLSDTMSGDGILFSEFALPVRYRGQSLFIKDGYVKGPALGINIWGTTNLDTKRLDFTGTLIPAYSINSIFGDVKSNGLGLVGIKYNLRGTYKTPQVEVNPLSIVLPGFMKVWFNGQRVDPYPALNLPPYKDDLDALRGKKK